MTAALLEDWTKVLEATEKHYIERVIMDLVGDDSPGWSYVLCACGETQQAREDFTDHIRRLVFNAMRGLPDE